MSDDKRPYRTQIIVAIISLMGVLGTALITNWESIFPPEIEPKRLSVAAVGPPAEVGTSPQHFESRSQGLQAPNPEKPVCESTIKRPPDNKFFVLSWAPTEGAATYTVEVDCFGCSEFGRTWHSLAGAPWHMKTGLGLRTPIYSSNIHIQLQEAGGLALRWRVWAVGHDGMAGQKSAWCKLSFFG